MCDRFVDVSNTVEFQFLPLERLISLLQDDQLNINSELDVYAALIRWIDSDRPKRICVAARLLRETVRLQCITPECLITHVEAVSWLFDVVPECQLIVNDALR
jgi:BTB And C-terminal Kelch